MSWRAIEHSLNLPSAQIGDALLDLTEGQWFDRKSGRVRAKDLAIVLVAMANAEGGHVAVGLHDGALEGVSSDRINELRQTGMDHTVPVVAMQTDEIEATTVSGHTVTLLLVRVEPGEAVHELTNGDCYLRVGDESRKLTFAQRQELHYDRGHAPYDGTAVPVDVTGLSAAQVDGYHHVTGSSRGRDHLLRSRSLLRDDGAVTVAAYLLFADLPQDRFPHATVRVLRYASTIRGTGSRQNLIVGGDVRCEGSIPGMIEDAADAVERLMPQRRVLGRGGRFQPEPMVPRDAWLEGLVNAVVHRSYSAAGDYVRVEIFDDRVEIESPGRFPGLVNPSEPLAISRYARNPRITRVCADLSITQELGEGIKRIFEEMRRRGLTDPVYSQTAGSVRLILSSHDAIAPDVRSRLPSGARDTLDRLRQAERPLGTGEVMELTGLSRPTTVHHLRALRAEGLVAWTGKSARDPRATWEIV